jgi:hypothetical protein
MAMHEHPTTAGRELDDDVGRGDAKVECDDVVG